MGTDYSALCFDFRCSSWMDCTNCRFSLVSFMKKSFIISSIFFLSLFGAKFVFATSGACSYHGGVDCSAGAAADGSVICNDGWTDSSVQYSDMDECQNGDSTDNAQITCPNPFTQADLDNAKTLFAQATAQSNQLTLDYENASQEILAGTYQLTSAQQAEIASVESQGSQLSQLELTAMKSAQGIAAINAERTGLAQSDPTETADIQNQVSSSGLSEENYLNASTNSSVAQMEQSFMNSDQKNIDDELTIASNFNTEKLALYGTLSACPVTTDPISIPAIKSVPSPLISKTASGVSSIPAPAPTIKIPTPIQPITTQHQTFLQKIWYFFFH